MFLRDNPESFLTGDDPFVSTSILEADRRRIDGEFVFGPEHEGFIGIPHGGLAMGLCLDAWRRLPGASYPVEMRFRFGGSGVSIGDAVHFDVERDPDGATGNLTARITKEGDKTPYLRGDIWNAASVCPEVGPPPSTEARGLPYYRNCFVCGHHRTVVGLQRRFRTHLADGMSVTSEWATSADDVDRAANFLIREEELHPAVLTAIFDENTAWAGFMQTRTCGLSVRADMTILRPVSKTEPLLFHGLPAGTRGNPRKPRFFLAEGTILSMKDPARPEPVAYGRGEWVVMDHYTQQIKQNLLPENDWQWIFGEDD